MNVVTLILKLLDLFTAGSLGLERLNTLKAQLKVFKDENREPTPAEWDALLAEVDDLSGRLDAADHKLNG